MTDASKCGSELSSVIPIVPAFVIFSAFIKRKGKIIVDEFNGRVNLEHCKHLNVHYVNQGKEDRREVYHAHRG